MLSRVSGLRSHAHRMTRFSFWHQRSHSKDYKVSVILGQHYLRIGNLDEAESAFTSARMCNPSTPQCYHELAIIALMRAISDKEKFYQYKENALDYFELALNLCFKGFNRSKATAAQEIFLIYQNIEVTKLLDNTSSYGHHPYKHLGSENEFSILIDGIISLLENHNIYSYKSTSSSSSSFGLGIGYSSTDGIMPAMTYKLHKSGLGIGWNSSNGLMPALSLLDMNGSSIHKRLDPNTYQKLLRLKDLKETTQSISDQMYISPIDAKISYLQRLYKFNNPPFSSSMSTNKLAAIKHLVALSETLKYRTLSPKNIIAMTLEPVLDALFRRKEIDISILKKAALLDDASKGNPIVNALLESGEVNYSEADIEFIRMANHDAAVLLEKKGITKSPLERGR